LPKYSEQQFVEVAIKVLPKIGENLVRYIGYTVFKNGGDIRDVISIGKLVRKNDGSEQISQIMDTMTKYSMVA
jgi:hypothetical protein